MNGRQRLAPGSHGLRRRAAVGGALAMVMSATPAQASHAPVTPVRCSVGALITAINVANSTAGADTLDLARGCTYTLVGPDNAANGLPVITGDIAINGSRSTITRDPTAPSFRIFTVSHAGTLTLNSATISGGKADADCPGIPGEPIACGGGIDNLGTLTVNNSRLLYNTAMSTVYAEGGGIDNDGTATIKRTEVSGNRAGYTGTTPGAATGGGVANDGSLSVSTSHVTHNTASVSAGTGLDSLAEGAGVENFASATVEQSTVTKNVESAPGDTAHGALINQGTMTVTATRVTRNVASAPHGQVAAAGIGSGPFSTLTMTRDVVSRNTGRAPGGLVRGGGLGMRESSGTVTESVFRHNTVIAPGGTARGGGIFGEGAAMTFARVKVTGNAAVGSIAQGGGLGNTNIGTSFGSITLANSAVHHNIARGTTSAAGGGIFNDNGTSGSVTLENTSVLGNDPDNCTPTIGACS
jgi:hypothetical protein